MPYIPRDQRPRARNTPTTDGELNYAITELLLDFLELKGLSYTTLNTIEGTLGSVGKEFFRRITAPYEDEKRRVNGDLPRFNQ